MDILYVYVFFLNNVFVKFANVMSTSYTTLVVACLVPS